MPACGDCKGMDKAAFGAHVQKLAEDLRDKVAEKAVRTVFMAAKGVRERAQYNANREAYEKAKENGTDVSYPVPLGPDHGYQYLDDNDKEIVRKYRDDYKVELLTFDAKDEEAGKEKLKNEELTWIVEKFARAKNFPDHNKFKPVLDKFVELAGDEDMVDIEFDSSQKGDSVESGDNGPTGQGSFGAQEFAFAGGMASSVEGFDSATGKSFRDQFVPRIPVAANNQKGAIRTIRNLLANNEGVYRWAREDIDGLLHDGLNAVEHFDDCKSGDDDVSATLGIVGGVAGIIGGIVGIPFTGGLSAAAIAGGVGAVSAGIGTARLLYLEDKAKDKKPLSGDTLDQVLEKIVQYADDTYGKLDEFNTALANDGFGRVDGHMGTEKVLFAAPKPLNEFMNSEQGNVRDNVESDTD